MPWSSGDMPTSTKHLSIKQRRQWRAVANKCMQEGKHDEATCIRIAHGAAGPPAKKGKG